MRHPTMARSTRAPAQVTVHLPGPLRPLADGRVEVVVDGATVGGALDAVLSRHPALRRHLRTEAGTLREHVNVFLNEEDVRHVGGEGRELVTGDVITVVASIAGG